MPIRPRKNEDQSTFMSRCMTELSESETKRPQEQMVAICLTAWREEHGGTPPSKSDITTWIARMREGLDKLKAERWVCGASRDLPLAETERAWDGSAAAKHMLDKANIGVDNDNGGQPNLAKRGFLIYDAANGDLRGSYSCPFADFIDGTLKAIPSGLRAAASRLPQVTDVSQATKDRARGVLDAYFGRMENDEKSIKAVNNEDVDVPEVEEDESRSEFLERCLEEVTDQDVSEEHANSLCALAWENRSGASRLRHKVHAENVTSDSLWTLSDETPDRMNDVIKADGWDLTNFRKNPVALWAHRSDMPPIGRWRDLHIENQSLRGYLELAPLGTSERVDEIRKLVEAGILKAVSVGFKPIHSSPRRNGDKVVGEYFQKQELVETSLVSVPANPNALAVAKSLNLSAATMDLVFGAEHGRIRSKDMRSDVPGEHAVISRIERSGAMSTLPQRISEVETQIRGFQDKLTDHLSTVDDSNVSDAQLEATKDLQERITQLQKQRDVLVDSEKLLAAKAANGDGTHRAVVSMNGQPKLRQNQIPTKKDERLDIIVRSGVCQAFSHLHRVSVEMARQQIAKEYPRYGEDATRVFNEYIARAATDPAMTTVDGWAAELVQMLYADVMELLLGVAVFPKLAALGLSLQFGRAGRISIPTRDNSRSVAGSFVGEGMPIPVRQALFAAQVLTPKKLAVIVSWTREMGEASIPAIEGLLRNAIQEDTAEVIDSTLLDAVAADTIRPAGLLNGVTPIAPTAGGGFAALVQDMK